MKIEDLCCVRIIDFSLLWPKSRRQKIATSIGNSLVSKYVLSITSLRFALASTLRLCSDGWWSCLSEHDYMGSFWAPICGGLGLATCAAFENGRYIFIGFAPRFAHCQRSRLLQRAPPSSMQSREGHACVQLQYFVVLHCIVPTSFGET